MTPRAILFLAAVGIGLLIIVLVVSRLSNRVVAMGTATPIRTRLPPVLRERTSLAWITIEAPIVRRPA